MNEGQIDLSVNCLIGNIICPHAHSELELGTRNIKVDPFRDADGGHRVWPAEGGCGS